ncbi:GNAT family N-acetyltransferase [Cryptosporangium aurantiacum]|uniref:Acetyltransferase (GNAT) family protein n=1 Tax=Cryptosporangium aurantiacum TaxID=134849 RepID=A0A1M7QV54_9ACTN|nr:GNAT family N-acetyltransferase [Cryptosporangium aurantiacum]SHN35773.1 Acetyltransferase (GNAT) family protein [Cryptosporangium aurantiacum]
MSPADPVVRPYDDADLDAVRDICVRTGHEGGDARPLYPDPSIFPTAFADPYVAFEPELAYVVDDGERAVGYIVGTADTVAFVKRYRGEWLPSVADRWPLTDGTSRTDHLVRLLHDPERLLWPELEVYPAHLHIDLLPDYQGRGLGRVLMNRFLGTLAARGVPAVHLGMVPTNYAARAFYDRLGFVQLDVPDPTTTYLGRSTAAD